MTTSSLPTAKQAVLFAGLCVATATIAATKPLQRDQCVRRSLRSEDVTIPMLHLNEPTFDTLTKEFALDSNNTCILDVTKRSVPLSPEFETASLETLAKRIDGETLFFFQTSHDMPISDGTTQGIAFKFALPKREILLDVPCKKATLPGKIQCYNQRAIVPRAVEYIFGTDPCVFALIDTAFAKGKGVRSNLFASYTRFLRLYKREMLEFWTNPSTQKELLKNYGDDLKQTCDATTVYSHPSWLSFLPFY